MNTRAFFELEKRRYQLDDILLEKKKNRKEFKR